jgi:hypothetical protein
MSDAFDPTNRELCPDGACIGVIGPDGTCNECGTIGQSGRTHSRLRGMKLPAPVPDDDDEDGDDFGGDGSSGGDDDPLDLEHRELCPDDACIGIIGLDGRCKECGIAAERGGS